MDIYFINTRLGLFIIHMKNVDCSKCRNSAPDSCTVMNLVDLAILCGKSALWGEITKLSKSNSLHAWLLLCCVCCNIGIKTGSEIIQFSYSKASKVSVQKAKYTALETRRKCGRSSAVRY